VTGHVDSETIAAFRENLLPADQAASVAAHLSGCPQCAEISAQFAAVTAILASAPAPPLPASVAARLDAALAAEVARAAETAQAREADFPPAAAAQPGAASPDAVSGNSAFPGAIPPAAALPDVTSPDAAAPAPGIIPAGGTPPPGGTPPLAGTTEPAGTAGPAGTGPSTGTPAADGRRARRNGRAGTAPGPGRQAGPTGTAPGRAAPGHPAGRPRTRGWRSLRLAAAAAVVVLLAGGGYAISRAMSAGNSAVSASSPASATQRSTPSGGRGSAAAPEAAPRAPVTQGLPLVASGTVYQAGQLPAQVRALLKRYPAFAPSPKVPPPVVSTAAFPHLDACVTALTHGLRPRLVDVARYGSRPAAVIVAPAAGGSPVRVWVVGTGCSARGGDVIAQLSVPAAG
jgi:hypothetical protein